MKNSAANGRPRRRCSPGLELATVATCWVVSYFLRFSFGGTAGNAAQTPPLRDYLVQLPLVLGVWRVTFGVMGLYRPRRISSHLSEWIGVTWASFMAGVVLLTVLRVIFAEYNYSRAVILIFVILSFLFVGASRTTPQVSRLAVWSNHFFDRWEQIGDEHGGALRLFRDPLVVGVCWLVVVVASAWGYWASPLSALFYFWLLAFAALGLSLAIPGSRVFGRGSTCPWMRGDVSREIGRVLLTVSRRRSEESSAWFRLGSDLLLLSACWYVSYLLWFFVVGMVDASKATQALRHYAAGLPVILFVSVVMLRAFGLYGRGEPRSFLFQWINAAKASAAIAVIVFWILRVVFEHRNYSRAVIVLFAGLSFIAVAMSRTMLSRQLGVAGRWVSARLLRSEGPLWSWVRRFTGGIRAVAKGRKGPATSFHPVVRWVPIVLGFNLLWYGSYLSFPLIGEDGAALYSSLVETVRHGRTFLLGFPIKWLEGLGQPNVFVSLTFDPFSWLLLSGLDEANAFRLSYALRATTCWFTTYLFISGLFRGARSIAVTGAFLGMLLSFTLTHPWGIPTFAGIFVATHAAVFPGLLWLYLLMVESRRRIGWADLAFALGLTLFLLMYPIGSLLGLPALFALGGGLVLSGRGTRRTAAVRALVKLVLVSVGILFAPVAGLYKAWSSLATVSARHVFAGELTTYGKQYLLPHLWHDVPLGVRIVVLLAISLVLVCRRWPGPMRTVGFVLGTVVVGSQLATIARASGILPHLLERLPRPFYAEYYLPAFYAAAAAYTLHRWPGLLRPPGREDRSWPLRVTAVGTGVWMVLGSWVALLFVTLYFGFVEFRGRVFLEPTESSPAPAFIPGAMVLVLFLGAAATWLVWPQEVHPVFARELSCRQRLLIWCNDPPGPSMGAGSTPITEFLKANLSNEGTFRGRAEFLLQPALRLAKFPIDSSVTLTHEEFERIRDWYARAYRHHRAWFPVSHFQYGATYFRRDPAYFRYENREKLIETMDALVRSGEPTFGILPDDVLVEVVKWAEQHPGRAALIEYLPAWRRLPEVTIMVEERNRNFLTTGNGMLLRALPLQGIPVASSYEQALDYLYYLVWTRYVNEGVAARRSINFTSLETIHPDRLALFGVRYVIARDMPLGRPPDLPRVFAWSGYTVYQIDNPNVSGVAPIRVVFGNSLWDELRMMRAPSLDPRKSAVVPESERRWFDGPSGLSPTDWSELRLSGQSVIFHATARGRALAVLPFRFSNCFRPEWSGRPGRVLRVNAALVGVLFEETSRLRLTWTAGYGLAGDCANQDRELMAQAIAVASQVPH